MNLTNDPIALRAVMRAHKRLLREAERNCDDRDIQHYTKTVATIGAALVALCGDDDCATPEAWR